jgi:membrane-associated phospholipid phosphatase
MRRNRILHCTFGIVLSLCFLSFGLVVRGQVPPTPTPTPTPSPPSLEKEFFKNILRDQKAIWTAPFHLRKADAIWIAPATVGTLALIATDRITGDEIAEAHGLVRTSENISYAGSIYGSAAIAGTFYLVGRKKNDYRARETGILVAQASVNGYLVAAALKGISQRVRPKDGRDRSEFFDGGTSFPSGHSTQAWAVATVIANEYHDRRLVQFAAYSVASAVSVARFTGGKHYLSDVLVGSALGYGIGQYVYRKHHRETPDLAAMDDLEKPSIWPRITPHYNRSARQYGIAMNWTF